MIGKSDYLSLKDFQPLKWYGNFANRLNESLALIVPYWSEGQICVFVGTLKDQGSNLMLLIYSKDIF